MRDQGRPRGRDALRRNAGTATGSWRPSWRRSRSASTSGYGASSEEVANVLKAIRADQSCAARGATRGLAEHRAPGEACVTPTCSRPRRRRAGNAQSVAASSVSDPFGFRARVASPCSSRRRPPAAACPRRASRSPPSITAAVIDPSYDSASSSVPGVGVDQRDAVRRAVLRDRCRRRGTRRRERAGQRSRGRTRPSRRR